MTLIAVLAGVGVLFRKFAIGKWSTRIAVSALLILGFFPIGHNMLVALENRNPSPIELPKKIDGIIVLGGSIDLKTSIARKQVQLNEHTARLTEMIKLAKRYPKAKLVFTGGDGNLSQSSSSESEQLNILLKNIGFNQSRVILEDKSRNTFENMLFSKDIIHPKEGQNWLLVTSAFHMPRAAAIFNTNQWQIIPYSAGYLTDGIYKFTPNGDVLGNMYKFQVAAREIIGIMAYTLTGRIKTDGKETAHSDFSNCTSDVLRTKSGG